MDNQTSEKIYISFLNFLFSSIFPPNFLSLAFSRNKHNLNKIPLNILSKSVVVRILSPGKEISKYRTTCPLKFLLVKNKIKNKKKSSFSNCHKVIPEKVDRVYEIAVERQPLSSPVERERVDRLYKLIL